MESELILTNAEGHKFMRRQNDWTLEYALIEWYVYSGSGNGFVRINDHETILNLEQTFYLND